MDSVKIGKLIYKLRKEKNLTQKDLANMLNIQPKTVSKWECGLGIPDISLWADLSNILEFDMIQVMEGDMVKNPLDTGNISKTKLYVCPECQNIITSTSNATIYCCGRKLESLKPSEKTMKIEVQKVDLEYFIKFDSPMTKKDFVSFACFVKGEKMILFRFYPEQSPYFSMPQIKGGILYLYSIKDGLFSFRNIYKLAE